MLEKEFLEAMIEELDIEEEVTMDTVFREMEDYTSLGGFIMLSFASEHFDKDITVEEFLKLNTFQEFFNYIK